MEKDIPPELIETPLDTESARTVSTCLPVEEYEKLMEIAFYFDGNVSEAIRALVRDSQGLTPLLPVKARAKMDAAHELLGLLKGRADTTLELFRGYVTNVEADIGELETRARNLVHELAQVRRRLVSTGNKGIPDYLIDGIDKAANALDDVDETLTHSYTYKTKNPSKPRPPV